MSDKQYSGLGSIFIVFILLLSITAFFFANNVIPYSEYKWLNLRRNIQQFKPSMVIAEGQFNQIGNVNIIVAEKSLNYKTDLRLTKEADSFVN